MLEGLKQHAYFTVSQIEKFYSAFFPKWKKEAYYELLKMLQVLPSQKLSTMSCGQRSQVALGLLFAQDPELLILDEPLHGLDMRNRRLVKDVIEAFCARKDKTLIMVTHYQEELPATITNSLFLKRYK